MTTPQLYAHQTAIADFIVAQQRALVIADPGTGKTAAVLSALERANCRAVVFCPKSIMTPAWVRDCETFTPGQTITVATAPDKIRRAAFSKEPNIVVINHDGAKWLRDNRDLLKRFDGLAIDESTAFKNKDSQRSKAIAEIRDAFDLRAIMSGTPFSNRLIDIWHQVYLVDDGEHLGARFYAFRAATHEPIQITPDIKEWVPKDGALEVVTDMISPISLRYRLEDCVDIPSKSLTHRLVDLSPKLRKHYREMENSAVLELANGQIQSVNAAVQHNKLLQIASGAVYGDGEAYTLAPERYDLVAQLVDERPNPCLIGFTWKHQRDGTIAALHRLGIENIAILDGEHNSNVDDTVQRFQAGEFRVLLAHPKSAGHGLTLTRAKTVIWPSPSADAEMFDQLNRRIYRTGQDAHTETIVIAARDTHDERSLARLDGRMDMQTSALDLLQMMMPIAA